MILVDSPNHEIAHDQQQGDDLERRARPHHRADRGGAPGDSIAGPTLARIAIGPFEM